MGITFVSLMLLFTTKLIVKKLQPKFLVCLSCMLLNIIVLQAQNFFKPAITIAISHQFLHDNIDKVQQSILAANSIGDSIFKSTDNLDVNLYATYLLKNRVDELQYFIEAEKNITEQDKFLWLRSLHQALEEYLNLLKAKPPTAQLLPNLIVAYHNAVMLHLNKQSIQQVVEENDLEIGKILIGNLALQGNSGIEPGKLTLITKLCIANPESTLKILSKYPDLPTADSLIIGFAYNNPQELYDYAASNTPIGIRIKNIKEPFIETIVQMANSNDGRFLFPFLDEISNKKITVEEIRKTVDSPDNYFRLLVKTFDSYELQKQAGTKILAMEAIADKIKAKAIENYITPINALHDEENLTIRFARIQKLSVQELYYITVMGEEELYTSSFIKGVYPKIIEGLGTAKTDSLLKLTHFAYYRKFLKMCAAFNMLEDFLSRMDKYVSEGLIKSFSNNLETYWSLEEAVDVADSYSCINDLEIKKIIRNEVEKSIVKNSNTNNKRGRIIYGLLQQIFASFDTINNGTRTNYEIPLVSQIGNADLKDVAGRIYVHQFFYGDKDGKVIFDAFVNNFRSNGWRVVSKPNWVEVSSNSNTPITIFANKPLNEEEGLDDAAQKSLNNYLDSLNIFPTVIIHRGHSYYVRSSLKQLTSYAKIVLLGSCGGYHSLSKVLQISPQAQIIASKQIGTGLINAALIEQMMENLKQGKDLVWPTLWKNLENRFANNKQLKEKFDDYIPPYKNLGAIFIMAFNKAMNR